MEDKTVKFKLNINKQTAFEVEASGTESIVDAFEKRVMTESFGLFNEIKDKITEVCINGMDLKMQTVFRNKKGQFVNLKDLTK